MEQPIGQNVTPTTTSAAGTDPAFIPGVPAQLDGSVPPALRGPGRKQAEAAEEAADGTGPAEEAEAAADGDDATEAEAVSDGADTDSADADPADSADDAEVDDGKPVFRVSDRRGSITADREGITFTLDSETAEFAWDEIGAVEIDTPRFGKRFSVTVYTSTRRWFQSDVEATSRKQLKQWEAELDAVLDARFEADDAEGAEGADGTEGADDAAEAAGDAGEVAPASAEKAAEKADAEESPKTAKTSKEAKASKEEPASADA